jgi:hypothetical protein
MLRLACFLALLTTAQAGPPAFFPNMTRVYLPRGTAQLVKPYLAKPTASTRDYRLVIEAPDYLQFVAVEPSVGRAPQRVTTRPAAARSGVKYLATTLEYDLYPGQGCELSICWLDRDRKTICYRPAVSAGGTFDWTHLRRTVTAPPQAAFARPILIKWQNRGIRGTFWVDNIVLRESPTAANLLPGGTFDDAAWKSPYLVPEGPQGSRCAKFVCRADQAERQQALWLMSPEKAIPVRAGAEYTVELDLKTDGVETPSAQLIAALLFRAAPNAPQGTAAVFTGVAANGSAPATLEQTELVILPPLKDVRPKAARIAPCLYEGNYEPQVAEAYAHNLWHSGMTWTYGSVRNNIVPQLWPRGHRVWLAKHGEPFAAVGPAADFLQAHPELGATRMDGKPKAGLFCPTWLLSSAGAEMRRAMDEEVIATVNRDGYSAVNWDIEQTVLGAAAGNDADRGFCLCARCQEAFRRPEKLDPGTRLDAEQLRSKHRQAWVTFRCQQNADLVGHLREALRRCQRPIEFSIYSGYQCQETREWYGVDWSLLASKIDLAIAGYGGSRKALLDTRAALGRTPLIGGENYFLSPEPPSIVADWMKGSLAQTPRPEAWRNRLLRQFIDGGCHGVLIWYLPTMDGGAVYYTSEAAQIIAAHEEIFTRGQRCDEQFQIDGLKADYWAAFEHQGKRLLVLLNFSDKPTTINARQSQPPAGCRATVWGETKPSALNPKAFTVTLAPRESKLFRFARP